MTTGRLMLCWGCCASPAKPAAKPKVFLMQHLLQQHAAMQRGVLDFMALSLGLICSLRPSSNRLTVKRPRQWLCKPQQFVMTSQWLLLTAGVFGFYLWYLTTQSWFTGGNGTSDQVFRSYFTASPAGYGSVLLLAGLLATLSNCPRC